MRKIIPIIMFITLSNTAMAEFLAGSNNSCYIDTYSWNESWFCGQGSDKCANKQATGGRRYVNYLIHGDSFKYDNKTYWCCNGTADKIGRFYQATNFKVTESKTIDVANGKCSYDITKDICGNIIKDEPCTEAEDCVTGIKKRNEVCIPPCDDGYAFEAPTSNRCIACPDTERQAIIGIGYDKECKKCKSTEILDRDTMTCKTPEKKEQEQKQEVELGTKVAITKETMAKCYRCPGKLYYKQCLLLLDAPHKLDVKTNKSDIRKQCFLN